MVDQEQDGEGGRITVTLPPHSQTMTLPEIAQFRRDLLDISNQALGIDQTPERVSVYRDSNGVPQIVMSMPGQPDVIMRAEKAQLLASQLNKGSIIAAQMERAPARAATLDTEAKRQRQRAHIGYRDDQVAGGTPETKAKLRPDPVLRMVRTGTLDARHLVAAEHIRDIYEAVTKPLWPRGMESYEADGDRTTRNVQPLERLPRNLDVVWCNQYKPWAAETTKMFVDGSRISYFSLTIEIIVLGATLSHFAGRMSTRKADAMKACGKGLRASLQRYCEIAGVS